MNQLTAQPVEQNDMGPSRRIAKNWAYLLSSSAFSQFLGMIALIRVARILSPAGYGSFNVVQTTAGIGLIVYFMRRHGNLGSWLAFIPRFLWSPLPWSGVRFIIRQPFRVARLTLMSIWWNIRDVIFRGWKA